MNYEAKLTELIDSPIIEVPNKEALNFLNYCNDLGINNIDFNPQHRNGVVGFWLNNR